MTSPEKKLFDAIADFVDARVREAVRQIGLDPRVDLRDVQPPSLRRRLRRAADRGELGAEVEKVGQSRYVARSAVEAWLKKHRINVNADGQPSAPDGDLDVAFGAMRAGGR